MLEIPQIAATTWTIIQPYLAIIAIKGIEEVGSLSVKEIWDAVKKKFNSKPETQKVLSDLLKDPDNQIIQGAFQYALQNVLHDDAAFAILISELAKTVGSDYHGSVSGSGALAQGTGSKAVGAGGIMIDGGMNGNIRRDVDDSTTNEKGSHE